jgi:hypothetical protein
MSIVSWREIEQVFETGSRFSKILQLCSLTVLSHIVQQEGEGMRV